MLTRTLHEKVSRRDKGGMRRTTNTPLGLILVGLVLDLSYLDLHSVLGESHILALHLLARVLADVLHDAVDDEADRGQDADEDEEQDEGEDAAGAHGAGLIVIGFREGQVGLGKSS